MTWLNSFIYTGASPALLSSLHSETEFKENKVSQLKPARVKGYLYLPYAYNRLRMSARRQLWYICTTKIQN